MRKNTFILFLLIAFVSVSCENTVLTQNNSAADPRPLATASPKERASKEFLEHYHKGLKIRHNGKFPEDVPAAIEEFKKASEINPDDKETYRQIAELYVSINRYEDAATYLRKLLEKDAEDAIAHASLAQVLIEHLGKYEEGLRETVIVEKIYGNDGLSYARARLVGKAYDGSKDYENAIKHYKIFLKGSSSPDADDYKKIKTRLSELEKVRQKSN